MDSYSFFKKIRTVWKTVNKARSEEYIMGGMVALQDAEQAYTKTPLYNARLEAQRTQDELERVSQDLVEARARNRELAAKNEALTAKLEITQQAEVAANKSLKAALATSKNTSHNAIPVDELTRQLISNAKATEGSLRARIQQLEGQSKAQTADGKVFPVAKMIRRIKSILSREELPMEQRLLWLAQNAENWDAALEGRKPELFYKPEEAAA